MAVSSEFLKARITATEAQITAYEDAVLALGDGIQSYILDTGQSRQHVTNQDLPRLQKTLDSLYNRHAVLNARLTGCGVVTVRPAF